ncbi:MAG TPA: 4Fe-4S binding protein [Chloroflexi bacterium]|nr:4Fe-4S binding protein [Chloroflexota bacterium]
MPNQMTLNPFILLKFALWIATVVVATLLLRRRQVTSKVRLAFLVGGVLVFGLLFGLLVPAGLNPNPVASLRTLLTGALVRRQIAPPVAAMLAILLLMVWVSNKTVCGWACQLGLLQDLLHRVKLPKWEPPFWLSNTVRIVAFVGLVGGLLAAGLDWIGVIDPFQLFSFSLTWAIALFAAALLVASLFVYRPWCRFLCPFGLVGWLVEQVSLLRPRINRDACRECQLCVKACPSGAMADFYADARLHADCFACGACIEACPHEDALGWRAKA